MIPGLGRSPGEGKGYPLQNSGLENSLDYVSGGRKESDTTERLSLSLPCWGLCFALGHGVSFFGGIQLSPVDGCLAVSCSFGVLKGEGERTSFFSIILCREKKKAIVKAVVFPVVMFVCESWTIKKAGCQRIYAFEL